MKLALGQTNNRGKLTVGGAVPQTFFPARTALAAFAIAFAAAADAACSWSFNWYCSDCAKIGGRTTGTQGGYSSPEQCESARRSVARGVTTVACSSSGSCEAPRGAAPGSTTGGGRVAPGGGASTPDGESEAIRRAEEDGLRREAEDAQRRAAEKAEDERRQREFQRSKLDAMKSLKGVDFDGSHGGREFDGGAELPPLKGSTPTFGIKTTPGKETPPEAAAERSSRFSKGNQFSAPVDLSTKDPAGPLTVDGAPARELVPDGQLGKFLAGRAWPVHVKAQTAVAILDLERGRPERAAETLKAAAETQPKDEFLRRAAAKAADAAKAGRLRFDPERFAKQLPKASYHAYVAAWEELEKGNMNGAARLFGRALDAAPGNAALQLLLAETEKRRRILSPEEQRQHDRRMEGARDYAQGSAALRLGLNAIHWNNAMALNYLDEAGRKMPGLEWEFVRLAKRQLADRSYADPGAYWKYRYRNRGEAMLDALEYGKGDWSASLRYLQHAGQIQKGNPVLDAAYRDLERLSKEAGAQ